MANRILATLLLVTAATACKKNSSSSQLTIRQDTLSVQSIIGQANNDDVDQSRHGFIDLYDGIAYTLSDAQNNSSKIDFAYNYHGGGCETCRFFENVKDMSTRTHYVDQFSTITNSVIVNAELYDTITVSDFESITTSSDIENLFAKKQLATQAYGMADITDRTTDVATGKVYAFIDKNQKKGFFKISDYVANVPNGDPATLTLYIKIEK